MRCLSTIITYLIEITRTSISISISKKTTNKNTANGLHLKRRLHLLSNYIDWCKFKNLWNYIIFELHPVWYRYYCEHNQEDMRFFNLHFLIEFLVDPLKLVRVGQNIAVVQFLRATVLVSSCRPQISSFLEGFWVPSPQLPEMIKKLFYSNVFIRRYYYLRYLISILCIKMWDTGIATVSADPSLSKLSMSSSSAITLSKYLFSADNLSNSAMASSRMNSLLALLTIGGSIGVRAWAPFVRINVARIVMEIGTIIPI